MLEAPALVIRPDGLRPRGAEQVLERAQRELGLGICLVAVARPIQREPREALHRVGFRVGVVALHATVLLQARNPLPILAHADAWLARPREEAVEAVGAAH